MTPGQQSVTAGWLVVFAALGVQNHWLTQITTWLGAPPSSSSTSKSLVPGTNLKSWQAALIAYAILMLVAESDDFAGLASIISWGVALSEILITVPLLKTEYPSLFTGGTSSTSSAVGSASGSELVSSQPLQSGPSQTT